MEIKLSQLKQILSEQLETAKIQTRMLRWLNGFLEANDHPQNHWPGTVESILWKAVEEGEISGEGEVYEAQGVVEDWLARNPLETNTNEGLAKITTQQLRTIVENEVKTLNEKTSAFNVALDLVGLIPGIGEGADLLNAADYARKGDYLFAALSLVSMIPTVGDAVGKGTKVGIWIAKAFPQGAAATVKHGPKITKFIAAVKDNKHKFKPLLTTIKSKAGENEKLKPLVDNFDKIETELDNFLEQQGSIPTSENVTPKMNARKTLKENYTKIKLVEDYKKNVKKASDFAEKVWKELKKINPMELQTEAITHTTLFDYVVYALVEQHAWDDIERGPKQWAERYISKIDQWKREANIPPNGGFIVPQGRFQFF